MYRPVGAKVRRVTIPYSFNTLSINCVPTIENSARFIPQRPRYQTRLVTVLAQPFSDMRFCTRAS